MARITQTVHGSPQFGFGLGQLVGQFGFALLQIGDGLIARFFGFVPSDEIVLTSATIEED